MTIEQLRMDLEAFVRESYAGREQVLVHGEGEVGAPIMMIGEAPGAREAEQRRPFVGKAGKNLDSFLQQAGLDRSSLYVTNTVKIRPTKVSATGRVVNRPPNRTEIELFVPWLLKEIEIVSPEYILTLGNVPLKALTGPSSTIGSMHGQFLDWNGRKLFAMYHPASVIYNPGLDIVYREDLLFFADRFHKGS